MSMDLTNEPLHIEIVKRRRSIRMRLSVHEDGRVRLSIPWRVSVADAQRFVAQHATWIRSKQAVLSRRMEHRLSLGGMGGYREHKDSAMALVLERLAHFNRVYEFVYHRVCVRNNASRWGSCSQKGNLNFHYKIIFLPQPLIDYLIVHELCHLKEFNHSARFWKLIETTIPDYRERRRLLRTYRLK